MNQKERDAEQLREWRVRGFERARDAGWHKSEIASEIRTSPANLTNIIRRGVVDSGAALRLDAWLEANIYGDVEVREVGAEYDATDLAGATCPICHARVPGPEQGATHCMKCGATIALWCDDCELWIAVPSGKTKDDPIRCSMCGQPLTASARDLQVETGSK